MLYILDTDIFSLLPKPDGRVASRVAEIGDSADIAICVVTKIEQLQGRFQQVITADSGERLLHAVRRLHVTELRLASTRTISFDERVAERFEALRRFRTKWKMGMRDFLIACICLARDATLVTRNVKDFQNVPGLKIENWAD